MSTPLTDPDDIRRRCGLYATLASAYDAAAACLEGLAQSAPSPTRTWMETLARHHREWARAAEEGEATARARLTPGVQIDHQWPDALERRSVWM